MALTNLENFITNSYSYNRYAGDIVLTTDATPTVVGSITPTDDDSMAIEIKFIARNQLDLSKTSAGDCKALFIKQSGSNIVRIGGADDKAALTGATKGNFASQPKISFVANGANIDIVATGLASTTILWSSEIETYETF